MADTQTDHPHSKRDRGQIAMGVRVRNPDDLANYGIDRLGTTIPYQVPGAHQSEDQTDFFLLPFQMDSHGFQRVVLGVDGRDVKDGNPLPVRATRVEKLLETLIEIALRLERKLDDAL